MLEHNVLSFKDSVENISTQVIVPFIGLNTWIFLQNTCLSTTPPLPCVKISDNHWPVICLYMW